MRRSSIPLVVLVALSSALVHAQESPEVKALNEAADGFRDALDQYRTQRKRDGRELMPTVIKVELAATNVLLSGNDDEKRSAALRAMSMFDEAAQVDLSLYFPHLKRMARYVVTNFPHSREAALGERYVLCHEVSTTDTGDFLEKVKTYHKTYSDLDKKDGLPFPNQTGKILKAYADHLLKKDPKAAAEFLGEGIQIYSGDNQIISYKRAIERIGTPVRLHGRTLEGKALDTDDSRGKVIVVHFWDITPGTGVRIGIPEELSKYGGKLRNAGIELIGVALTDDEAGSRARIREDGIDWPQLYLADPRERKALREEWAISYLSRMFVIGKDGKLLTAGAGEFDFGDVMTAVISASEVK